MAAFKILVSISHFTFHHTLLVIAAVAQAVALVIVFGRDVSRRHSAVGRLADKFILCFAKAAA